MVNCHSIYFSQKGCGKMTELSPKEKRKQKKAIADQLLGREPEKGVFKGIYRDLMRFWNSLQPGTRTFFKAYWWLNVLGLICSFCLICSLCYWWLFLLDLGNGKTMSDLIWFGLTQYDWETGRPK